jgi:hypothetical protein
MWPIAEPFAASLPPLLGGACGPTDVQQDERGIGSPRGLPPGTPTDPDMPDEGIRLFEAWVRYVRPAGRRAGGSGWWRRICAIRSHVTFAFCERRSSHVRQIFTT